MPSTVPLAFTSPMSSTPGLCRSENRKFDRCTAAFRTQGRLLQSFVYTLQSRLRAASMYIRSVFQSAQAPACPWAACRIMRQEAELFRCGHWGRQRRLNEKCPFQGQGGDDGDFQRAHRGTGLFFCLLGQCQKFRVLFTGSSSGSASSGRASSASSEEAGSVKASSGSVSSTGSFRLRVLRGKLSFGLAGSRFGLGFGHTFRGQCRNLICPSTRRLGGKREHQAKAQ